MVEDIYALESRDGIRCTWQNWPNNKVLATRNVIPVCVMYTPLQELASKAEVEYEPVTCNRCKSVLNPNCPVDFIAKAWGCPICLTRNIFPPEYKEHISETVLPRELLPGTTSIEYILPSNEQIRPVFVFVVDTCGAPEELNALKSALQQALNFLPVDSLVGLVTFGRNAYIYNLSWADCTRCYAFRGDKVYDLNMIREQLGLTGHDPRGVQVGARKFLVPLSECEYQLNAIFEELQRDSWPSAIGKRPLRCIGNALNLAVSILEIAYPKQGARVQLFTGGAATFGPGMIVGQETIDTIRTQNDIKNDRTTYMKPAVAFYNSLAVRAATNGHVVDIFSCAIDQVGLLEMKSLIEKTNGYLVSSDTFNSEVFIQSFQRIFAKDSEGYLKMNFCASVTLLTSTDIKIHGMIGPGHSIKQKNLYASEIEIGMGQTNTWFFSSLDSSTTLAFYIDIANQDPNPSRQFAELQFETKYEHPSGRTRLKVTTVRFPLAEQAEINKFVTGFDEETATVAIARWAVIRGETEEPIDVIRWLDRTLIRLAKKFAEYEQELPHTFRLCKEFALYPQFMFHMRRSEFLQTFNVSPDEATYLKSHLVRENVTNSLLMIEPALLEYSFESPHPEPVLLDIVSLKDEIILLLDTFFIVLIWHGNTIKKWKKAGYHEQPEYESFKMLLELPREGAAGILSERFPVPRFIETEVGKGDERILKAKVNPSGGGGNVTAESGLYFSEDVSLKVFMDHLIQYAVKS